MYVICEIKSLCLRNIRTGGLTSQAGDASTLTVTHVLHHSRSDMSRQEWTIRTLVSFLKATLLPGGGSDARWVRPECCPRDEEDREDAPDDRRRRGGCGGGTTGAWGAAAAAAGRSTTELLGPPPTGRLAPLFRRIMALRVFLLLLLCEFFSRLGLCIMGGMRLTAWAGLLWLL